MHLPPPAGATHQPDHRIKKGVISRWLCGGELFLKQILHLPAANVITIWTNGMVGVTCYGISDDQANRMDADAMSPRNPQGQSSIFTNAGALKTAIIRPGKSEAMVVGAFHQRLGV